LSSQNQILEEAVELLKPTKEDLLQRK